MQPGRDPDDICREMAVLRENLLREKDAAVADARTLTDWRIYFRSHPWLLCTAAGALGFLAVPQKARTPAAPAELLKSTNGRQTSAPDEAIQREVVGAGSRGLAADALGIALSFIARQSLNYATRRGLDWLDARVHRHPSSAQPPAGDQTHEESIW